MRNAFTKSIMWRSTGFLRHVVSEKGGSGAIMVAYVCKHCKSFPVEDFLWWVGANHGEKKKNTKRSIGGWWCGAGGMTYDWRKPNRLLTLHIGNTVDVQCACGRL